MNANEQFSISKQSGQNHPQDDQKVNSTSKPFLSKFNSKATPIGFDKHQVKVPELIRGGKNLNLRKQQLAKRNDSLKPQPTFLASKVKQEELQEYLNFAQKYFQDKMSDYFSTALASRERIRAKAIQFLHKMEYNYIKAKFYIIFPYYLHYNSYRCHQPLRISDEEMKKKINDHVDSLKNTKERDMQKWIQGIEQSLENRVNLNKILSLIEMGKQNKYQVPQNIKQQIEKSQKTGKQIKKFIQGNKYTIDVLNSKKEQLLENRIVTGQMISFEDTVNRCEEWIKKQKAFEEKHFQWINRSPFLRLNEEKIQFRVIQLLVNQYNNLPLLYETFDATTNRLCITTKILLDKIPTFKPAAKTRTARENIIHKISYKVMKESLRQIDAHPVCHEQFSNFQITMRQSQELIQRISMYLEDSQSDKSIKVLNNYLKLINDVQIENKLEKRLQLRVEYYEIMERIKRELANPGKVQSIKQAFNKLKEKGFKEIQDSGYQEKIILYLGWYESQQKLKEQKVIPSHIQIMKRELEIKKKMVNIDEFKSQFQSAKSELNIGEQALEENEIRIQKHEIDRKNIIQILSKQDPNLEEMVTGLLECIEAGFEFPQFEQLYDQIIKFFMYIIKMHYLLKIKNENMKQMEEEFYFSDSECDEMITIMINHNELKDLKTKEGAMKILNQIKNSPFPKDIPEWRRFEKFMDEGQKWCDHTMEKIKEFKEKGTNINVKQLQQSVYFLHSKAIKDQLNRIDLIMKWRQKISRKLDEEKQHIFDEEDERFMEKLERELMVLQKNQLNSEAMESKALEFSLENSLAMRNVLEKINNCKIDSFCKLSEMNKFYREIQKEIDRHKFDDKIINEQKDRFKEQIAWSDDWKQRYMIIKRFEKKKIKRDDERDNEDNKEEQVILGKQGLFPQEQELNENTKKRYSIKNGQFSWYFKVFLVTLQFYKGYKLRFCLEELQKLKNTLSEIWKFLQHYYKIYEKGEPVDSDISVLEGEGSKISLFIRQYWILKKHWNFIQAWKAMADSVLESVPIIGMELKARKPEQLLKVLQTKKIQTEEAQKASNTEEKIADYGNQKRQRKPNKLYNNEDITLLTEENAGPKMKKKRKGNNNDGEYRNTAVASQAKKNAISNLQQIQRTQALLKGQYAPNLICIEDPKQYCICRYGEPNQNTTMLQCQEQNCEEWFHIECIGIKKHQAKNDLSYICVGCHSLRGQKSSVGNFYWDNHSKISEFAFNQIVQEGQNLGAFTNQMKKVSIVKEKMDEWKKNANDILERVMVNDLNHKPLKEYQKQLYELYLHSLWLPTFHPEGETIKLMVQICRGQNIL